MLSEEKDILLRIMDKIRDKRLNKNRIILDFIQKRFKKGSVEDLTKKEKYSLLEYLNSILK